MAVTKYFDLHNVILIGQSLGGFYAPRASAFDDRVTKCVSIAQFGALILITNKTVDKKSSHNPYMQDYAKIFCTVFNWFLVLK